MVLGVKADVYSKEDADFGGQCEPHSNVLSQKQKPRQPTNPPTHPHTSYIYCDLEHLLQSKVVCSQFSIVNLQDASGVLHLSVPNLKNIREGKNDVYVRAGVCNDHICPQRQL